MDAERKQVARLVKRLARLLRAGDAAGFSAAIEQEGSKEIFAALREQKLLLHAPSNLRPIVSAMLAKLAERHLSGADAARFGDYLQFTMHCEIAHRSVAAALADALGQLPTMNLPQLMGAAGVVMNRYFARLPKVGAQPGCSVADYERRLGDLNGLANDTYYAVLRCVNEAAKIILDRDAPDMKPPVLRRQVRSLERITFIASKLNAFEWLFNSVSYGDMHVILLPGSDPVRFRLDFTDPSLSLLRTLSIRRDVVAIVFYRPADPTGPSNGPLALYQKQEGLMSWARLKLSMMDWTN